MRSDSLARIHIEATPGILRLILFALQQPMPAGLGNTTCCRASTLKSLNVRLLAKRGYKHSQLERLIETLTRTLERRERFNSHLDSIVLSECLTTPATWRSHVSDRIAEKTRTTPCQCESHSVASDIGSDAGVSDDND